MGKLHACFVVGILALAAACGDDGGAATKMDAAVDAPPDAKIWMDAPPPMFDLSCMGNAQPGTAPANIALSGTVAEANFNIGTFMFSVDPVADAQVEICTTAACGGNPPSTNSDIAGDWAFATVATGGTPFNAYLSMTEGTVRTTYVYPGVPFRADQAGIPILTFGPGVLQLLDNAGCQENEVIMAVAVTDCMNMPITDSANIDIVVKQNGTVVTAAQVTDLSTIPMAPPQVAGLFLVCDVPANAATEIGAMYNGMNLLAHNVKTVAGDTTTTQIRPGY